MSDNRRYQVTPLTIERATSWLNQCAAFSDAVVSSLEFMSGGQRNSLYRVSLANATDVVIRLYEGDKSGEVANKEAAIAQLLQRNNIASVQYYDVAQDTELERWYAIVQWVDAQSLADAVAHQPADVCAMAFAQAGAVLANIHAIDFAHSGFFDGQLGINAPIEQPAGAFKAYVFGLLANPLVAERLGWQRVEGLQQRLIESGPSLDALSVHNRLSHMDFGPENILVDKTTGQIVAVIDWEFGASLSPLYDIGHMLRPSSVGVDQQAFIAGYNEHHKETLGEAQIALAALLDVVNHLDNLGQAKERPDIFAKSLCCIDALLG